MKPAAQPQVRRRLRAAETPRDMDATVFTVILADLIARIPGAHAAALVDRDGEAVDYAGDLSPFDIKVAAAHFRIVLSEIGEVELLSEPRHVVIRGQHRSFILRALTQEYAVVIVLRPWAGFAPCTRAFAVFERALIAEAGIGRPHDGPLWRPIVVECDARARPRALAEVGAPSLQRLEVLGAVMGLKRGERGFRVRVTTGLETTVIREPGGAWYAEDAIDRRTKRPPKS